MALSRDLPWEIPTRRTAGGRDNEFYFRPRARSAEEAATTAAVVNEQQAFRWLGDEQRILTIGGFCGSVVGLPIYFKALQSQDTEAACAPPACTAAAFHGKMEDLGFPPFKGPVAVLFSDRALIDLRVALRRQRETSPEALFPVASAVPIAKVEQILAHGLSPHVRTPTKVVEMRSDVAKAVIDAHAHACTAASQ